MLPEKNCFSTALRAASAALGRFLHEMNDAFQDCVIEMACSYVFFNLMSFLRVDWSPLTRVLGKKSYWVYSQLGTFFSANSELSFSFQEPIGGIMKYHRISRHLLHRVWYVEI